MKFTSANNLEQQNAKQSASFLGSYFTHHWCYIPWFAWTQWWLDFVGSDTV